MNRNNSFALSDDDNKGVFEQIFDMYARGKATLCFPRLAILGGQPGAGKSTIVRLISESFDPDEQPVIAAIDDLRDFHLAKQEIFSCHPFEFAFYTNEEAWTWTSKLLTQARTAKNNAIYETTLRTANPIEFLIKTFQTDGFAVDLHALAVNSKTSVQGIYARYETQYRIKSAPRWTPIAFHDEAYRNFPGSVATLEANAGLETVRVYRRDGAVLYRNGEAGLIAPAADKAITVERAAHWSAREKARLVERWVDILALIEERSENKPTWYMENAKRLHREAELFQASRDATSQDRLVRSSVEAVTHHHVFARDATGNELVAFDIAAATPSILTKCSLRLLTQPAA